MGAAMAAGAMQRQLERMTWRDVQADIKAGTPIVLPVGAIEQRGPHLPLGTDGFIPYHIATETAAQRRTAIIDQEFPGG